MRRFLLASLFVTSIAFAGKHEHKNSFHIPAGVMRSHIHEKGETMMMYSTSNSFYSGVKGSTSSALATYSEIPETMYMSMDMLGVMHGLTENLTVSAMFSYMTMKMETNSNEASVGRRSHTTLGFGDSQLDAMYRIISNEKHHLQANLGVVLPTGDIDAMHTMYMDHGHGLHTHEKRNGYNMQLGTGSYSLTPGVNYAMNFANSWQFNTQANATVRLNDNNNGYRFGNIYNLTSWVSRDFNYIFGASARLDFTKIDAISCKDSQINPSMSPMNVPALTYRDQLTALIGTNINLQGAFSGTKIQAEFGVPLYQRIGNGMPKNAFVLNAGLQYSF